MLEIEIEKEKPRWTEEARTEPETRKNSEFSWKREASLVGLRRRISSRTLWQTCFAFVCSLPSLLSRQPIRPLSFSSSSSPLSSPSHIQSPQTSLSPSLLLLSLSLLILKTPFSPLLSPRSSSKTQIPKPRPITTDLLSSILWL